MKPSVLLALLVFVLSGCDFIFHSSPGDQPAPDTLIAPLVPDNDPAWQRTKRPKHKSHIRHKKYRNKIMQDSLINKQASLRTGQPL